MFTRRTSLPIAFMLLAFTILSYAQSRNETYVSAERVISSASDDMPAFSIPFTVNENDLSSSGLNFGIAPGATKDIDVPLGEWEYPPLAPGGGEAMFPATTGATQLLDLRGYSSPTQIDTYVVEIALGNYDTTQFPMTFSWPDLNSFYSGPVNVKFSANGSDFDIDMTTQTQYIQTTFPGDPSSWPGVGRWYLYIIAEGPLVGTSLPVVSTAGFVDGALQAIVHAPSGGISIPKAKKSMTSGATIAWFEYGPTKSYGTSTTHQTVDPGASVNLSQPFDESSLPPDTRVHFRAVAQNVSGTFYGEDRVFSKGTPPPEEPLYIYVDNRWNLVSIATKVSDYRKTALFPSAISDAFAYQGNYAQKDTLENSRGYWLKFSETERIPLNGDDITLDSIDVARGWNLIGSISSPVLTVDVFSDQPDMTTSDFWGYRHRYVVVDTIQPGKGYWVKVNRSGKLILSALPAKLSMKRVKIVSMSELPPPPPEGGGTNEQPVPTNYGLTQNYPNPFNPTTVIRYQLPIDGYVNLTVYDILGQEIRSLVNGVQEAGFKFVEFDATSLPSGVYFYKLSAGNALLVRKMLLAR